MQSMFLNGWDLLTVYEDQVLTSERNVDDTACRSLIWKIPARRLILLCISCMTVSPDSGF
jgi:hypothetical protein